jgi:hypothetical protein
MADRSQMIREDEAAGGLFASQMHAGGAATRLKAGSEAKVA